ncbi:MAG: hypothetical protein SFX74_00550 [Fimbriimonadaceae bacterium]|nr:hypothetical protein [Fimbriimonadaceae bacterium]
MISCQLTKLETALDQIKKQYPKLVPADAALIAGALSLTGRHALAVFRDESFEWPKDLEKLSLAIVPELKLVQEALDHNAPKKASKTVTEEEPVYVNVGLKPHYEAGEKLLADRDDLKNLLSEILAEGVEFSFSPNDIGWQWALERVNWNTVAGSELSRRIKLRVNFTEGAVGVEVGGAPKKRAPKKVAEVVEPVEAEEPVVAEA